MKTVAVLLTVFNRKEKTLKCLQNLYAQLPIEDYAIDVYLTNDGCTDGTPEVVAEQFPKVHIIQGDGSLFWNRGMYTAWEEAAKRDYDFYLWLNDDTFLFNDALRTIFDSSVKVGDKSIVCGATCSAVDSKITYGGRDSHGLVIPDSTTPKRCDHFNGNVVLIPRFVYDLLGNLDYNFRHAYGDFDYGLRAKSKKIDTYQTIKFIGTCELHDSSPKWCNTDISLMDRLKAFNSPLGGSPKENFYFEKKHHNLAIALLHYFTIHLRLFFPKIWSIKNK